MASPWQNSEEEAKPWELFKLELDVKESDAGVYENAPTTFYGVVCSIDQVDNVMCQHCAFYCLWTHATGHCGQLATVDHFLLLLYDSNTYTAGTQYKRKYSLNELC